MASFHQRKATAQFCLLIEYPLRNAKGSFDDPYRDESLWKKKKSESWYIACLAGLIVPPG
jgi:hypothetical protein